MTTLPDTCLALYPGRTPDLMELKVEDIDFDQIAVRLSRLNRWVGGTVSSYSVAQHSVAVMDWCQPHARDYALLHDAHEAFIGDIIRPVRKALAAYGGSSVDHAFSALTKSIDAVIHEAAGLLWPPPAGIAEIVAQADDEMQVVELRDLTGNDPAAFGLDPHRVGLRFTPWPAETAAREWRRAFQQQITRR